MTAFLQRLFKIRPGEFNKTLLMFLYAFNCTAAFIIGRITKDTLFLDKSDLSLLPYMYIIVALAVGIITIFYTRQVGRISQRKIMQFTFALIIMGLLAFRWLLSTSSHVAVYPALYVFIEIMGIMLMIQFWTFANELFNSREARRLFAIIGGGQVLANLYSFPIRSLKEYIGFYNLLYVCLISVLLCLIIFSYLSRRYRLVTLHRGRFSKLDSATSSKKNPNGVFAAMQKHIVGLTMLTILAATFVDYQFKVTASHHFSGDELADFLFGIVAYGGLFACFVQFFLTSRILEKFGILWGLLILPILFFGGSMVALATVGIIGVTLTRGSELVTRYTLTETTTNLLYQPLPRALLRRTKALSDGVMRPMAQVVAGVLFVILNASFGINEPQKIHLLSYAILAISAIWIVMIVSAKNRYVEALFISSERPWNRIGNGSEEEDEKGRKVSRIVLQRALSSEDEVQIVNAIEVIPLYNWAEWDESILPLLKHPSTKVRIHALSFLEKSGNRKYSYKIQPLFGDEDETVRAFAIQAYCSLEKERAIPLIEKVVTDPSPRVKGAAIAGLIHHGGLDGIMSSTSELKKMLDSQDPVQRRSGAQILGHIKIKSFYQPLFKLINDPDQKVRQSAIHSAGEMQALALIPSLIGKLGQTETSTAATTALASYGTAVHKPLDKALKLGNLPAGIRVGIPAILGQIPHPHSYELLEPLIEAKSDKLRSEATRAMQRLFALMQDDLTPDIDRIGRTLHSELQNYFQLLQHRQSVETEIPDARLLLSALLDSANDALERAFYLLGILHSKEQIEIVSYNMHSDNPALRAIASEIVDNICDNETKRYLLPILDNVELSDKLAAGEKVFHLEVLTSKQLIRQLLVQDHDEWLVTCCLHAIGECVIGELESEAAELFQHPSPVVRESVLFAMKKLQSDEAFLQFSGRYLHESDPVVLKYLDAQLA